MTEWLSENGALLSLLLLWAWVAMSKRQLRQHEEEHCAQIGELQDTVEYLCREHGVDRDRLAAAIASGELRA